MRDVSELVLFVSAFVVAAPGRYYNPYHSELYISIYHACQVTYRRHRFGLWRCHPRCTTSLRMKRWMVFLSVKHVSVHVVVHPRRGVLVTLRDAFQVSHVHATYMCFLDTIVTEEKSRYQQFPVAVAADVAKSHTDILFFMSNYSPPLNIVNLSPLPKTSHRVPSYHSLSTTSVLSSTPSTPSSLPTHSVGSTKARPSFPPPSAYIGHRRERSKEVLQHLSVLAPAKEAYVQDEAKNRTRHRNRQALGENSTTGGSMRTERGPKPTPEMSTNGHAPAPVPQQKKGFFRRLSLASGGSNSTAQVQPSNKLGKRNKEKETQVQGQAYEQLDAGSAPSGFKVTADMKRTKSKDRGFWSRGDKSKSHLVCAMKNILKDYVGTTPTPSLASQSSKPPIPPPATSSYIRPSAFPELDSSSGPYPSFPTANPSHHQQQQHSQQSYRQQPSFGGFSQEGPYPQIRQFPQPQIHQPRAQYPQPQQQQQPQQMYQQQNQFKPFRTPSQNRAPVHPALASSPSPVSTTTASPAQKADPTGSGSVRSPYGSPQDGRAPRAFGGPSLGQENVRPVNGREEGARKGWLNGEGECRL